MESESSVMLESCGEHSILIQTVKDMVNENTRAELESEEEGFFVVTDVQGEQQNMIEVSNEESTVTQSDDQFSWSNLCRICANVNDHLIPIFDGEGLQHDLCSKIHKYLPICVRIYFLIVYHFYAHVCNIMQIMFHRYLKMMHYHCNYVIIVLLRY